MTNTNLQLQTGAEWGASNIEKVKDTRSDLIRLFAGHGVKITTDDIPQILARGADYFLTRRGVTLPDKMLLDFYLILNEMRK